MSVSLLYSLQIILFQTVDTNFRGQLPCCRCRYWYCCQLLLLLDRFSLLGHAPEDKEIDEAGNSQEPDGSILQAALYQHHHYDYHYP